MFFSTLHPDQLPHATYDNLLRAALCALNPEPLTPALHACLHPLCMFLYLSGCPVTRSLTEASSLRKWSLKEGEMRVRKRVSSASVTCTGPQQPWQFGGLPCLL
jgi:hypothetical protein